jgi:hypothetical protein
LRHSRTGIFLNGIGEQREKIIGNKYAYNISLGNKGT